MSTLENLDQDQDEQPRRSDYRRKERKIMLEQEVKKVYEDEMYKAREIVMIRKELNRLHYKVKTYHNQTRLVNAIVQLVMVALLLVIAYKLFTADLPANP